MAAYRAVDGIDSVAARRAFHQRAGAQGRLRPSALAVRDDWPPGKLTSSIDT
jgi:hypothetical protein